MSRSQKVIEFQIRKEGDDNYIVKFKGKHDYFVVNETAKDVLDFLSCDYVDGMFLYFSTKYPLFCDSDYEKISVFCNILKEYNILDEAFIIER
jgi:hypothetical protein